MEASTVASVDTLAPPAALRWRGLPRDVISDLCARAVIVALFTLLSANILNDYLHTGKKFHVPFDVMIVFATNLQPESLADEAFLRRIPYKIPIVDPTVDQFTRIFELNCRRRNLRFHQVMVAYLQRRHYNPVGRAIGVGRAAAGPVLSAHHHPGNRRGTPRPAAPAR